MAEDRTDSTLGSGSLLEGLAPAAEQILDGQVRGRVLVDVNA